MTKLGPISLHPHMPWVLPGVNIAVLQLFEEDQIIQLLLSKEAKLQDEYYGLEENTSHIKKTYEQRARDQQNRYIQAKIDIHEKLIERQKEILLNNPLARMYSQNKQIEEISFLINNSIAKNTKPDQNLLDQLEEEKEKIKTILSIEERKTNKKTKTL